MTETMQKPVEAGWHPAMTMEDYIALPALSASGLEEFRRSPLHYQEYLKGEREVSRAMELGTALHIAALEPELFDKKYVVAKPCEAILGSGARRGDRCEKPGLVLDGALGWLCGVHGKETNCRVVSRGQAILSQEEWEATKGMCDAIHAHDTAGKILSGLGAEELTGVWHDQPTDVLCKMRPDRYVNRARMHVNIKTTRDASFQLFTRDSAARGYHRREAFYRIGFDALLTEVVASGIIAVENTPPYAVATYIFEEQQLAIVRSEVRALIDAYAICSTENYWPGYPGEFQMLNVPAWAIAAVTDDQATVFGATGGAE